VRSSTYEPLNERTHEGHWHQLTVRTNKVGESMINVHFHPQNLPVETVTEEKERLRKYCQTLTGPVTLTFVYWVVDDRQ
jgi:tRNA (uracil-5-)-methyltransferase